jgi:hypothetical protein
MSYYKDTIQTYFLMKNKKEWYNSIFYLWGKSLWVKWHDRWAEDPGELWAEVSGARQRKDHPNMCPGMGASS